MDRLRNTPIPHPRLVRRVQRPSSIRLAAALLAAAALLPAQGVRVVPASTLKLPTHIDGNSPAFWNSEGLNLFSSTGYPEMISTAPSLDGQWSSRQVDTAGHPNIPLWIESAWRDDDGAIYGWYHHEPPGVCGSSSGLTAPKIGAVVSYDEGRTVRDLGIVLEARHAPDCTAKNGFFAGGHGDFSVVLDRERKYFYFFFTNYSGPLEEQGVAVARLAFADRLHPAGSVWKFHQGQWNEPGLAGRTTPLFAARQAWQRSDTDSFWGPAVHWNTYLQQYVMLLNRSCCSPGWPQEGIYAAFGKDPLDLLNWKEPTRILDGEDLTDRPGYYPQVIGLARGETDSLAGETVRLFIMGVSRWTLDFTFGNSSGVAPPGQRPVDLPLPMEPDPR